MKIKIIAILILILLALIALFLIFKGDKETAVPNSSETAETGTVNSQEDRIGVGTLRELASRGKSYECIISYRPNEFEPIVEGSYFTLDNKVRADFVVQDANLGEVVTSYIQVGDVEYVWSTIGGTTYGVVSNKNTAGPEVVTVPVPEDVSVRYNCQDWVQVDGSIFEPPSGVLFKNSADADMEYGTIYEEGEFPF